ncbi:Fic family protein [Dyadobacter sp. CY312]|uniref:Fic family protein n=1 Tax=Dyadobacter sp. CY312 TaxID=2907303 RepID=UPI001F355A50|nr:Fic family protein [Dyadobacter sp. CY312]MCE7041392.1 Fic family protein [Dyadobacter sp. CY312]
MAITPAGALWLQNYFDLKDYQLTHKSYIGSREHQELAANGDVIQVFGPRYAPETDSPEAHFEFALKYDDLNLDFYHAVFEKIDFEHLSQFVCSSLSGKYKRKTGFLYEWLTKREIKLPAAVSGNYIDLLDDKKYVTGHIIKNAKWRINDNLLGNQNFCPIVRKTAGLQEALLLDLPAEIEKLKREHSPQIFNRAILYLYRKETKSSYEIERENPSADRMDRFISLLNRAGTLPADQVLSEEYLTFLQNAIVDERFSVNRFRDFQNYIGQATLQYGEIYHYICPPPSAVEFLMAGLRITEKKSAGNNAIIRAAIVAFGFVFIHPFEDGNGRLHRFLIHDILARDGVVEKGLIIPVSARMMHQIQQYDSALEMYSKPLMRRIRYQTLEKGEIKITNQADVESYFRYPDLTYQCIYLSKIISEAVSLDMSDELLFLERYDELKKTIQNRIDMPDKDLNQLIMFLHQNKGVFPNRRKSDFPKLYEEEFSAIQQIYQQIFV